MWGACDRIFSPSVGQTLQATIPGSSFLQVPNSGHLPQWENPGFVNPALVQFLAGDAK
jgi:pimeloyl-ACP methyl ester carboxylesterase